VRLALAQINATVGDIAGNEQLILRGDILFGELGFLTAPSRGDTGVEIEDSAFHCLDQTVEPSLKSPFFGTGREHLDADLDFSDNVAAGVDFRGIFLQPLQSLRIRLLLGPLTEDVSVNQPTHDLRR